MPFAASNDRLIIAYSPLAQGFLAAKYDVGNRPGGVRVYQPAVPRGQPQPWSATC